MSALLYEFFVRRAFNTDSRGGDPAGLAEADIYNTSYDAASLNKLKIGTGYAIAIYNHEYLERKELRDPDDYEKLEQFLAKVFEAKNGNDIAKIIEEYQEFEKELKKLPDR